MKMKTSELEGAALDWAVAKCEGLPLNKDSPESMQAAMQTAMQAGWWLWDGEGQNQIIGHHKTRRGKGDGYAPSTDWAQGGPIIEQESIQLTPNEDMESWSACLMFKQGVEEYSGPTPLIAAMRCYVASKLGDEVTIPEEVK